MGMFGPGMTDVPRGMGNVPQPRAPQPPSHAARESFYLLPQQPQAAEVAATLEHLTGRPADPGEVGQMMTDLQVTYGDYAPGGEVGPGNASGDVAIR